MELVGELEKIIVMFLLVRAMKCLKKDFYHLRCENSKLYLKVIGSYILLDNKVYVYGGSVAEWFRVQVLQSGGPGFKVSTLSTCH